MTTLPVPDAVLVLLLWSGTLLLGCDSTSGWQGNARPPDDVEAADGGKEVGGERDGEVAERDAESDERDAAESETEAGSDAGPTATPCWSEDDCREDEHCYNSRDWQCGVQGAECVIHRPYGTKCAGVCRLNSAPQSCLPHTCPPGYYCPADIHGTRSGCQPRVPLGERCIGEGLAPCLKGLTCDRNMLRCVANSSPPGTPCDAAKPCYGDAWCIAGECHPQRQRNQPCVRGSCGPLDFCDDLDQFGPSLGTCVERTGTPCTSGCASNQYCDDVDGDAGPTPGDCRPLIADGQPCFSPFPIGPNDDAFPRDERCASGLCRRSPSGYVCTPKREIGEACEFDADCRSKACGDGRCRDNGLGSACNHRLLCAPGLWCSESGTCHEQRDEGGNCEGEWSCKGGLWCPPASAKCQKPSEDGGSCHTSASAPCKTGLICTKSDESCVGLVPGCPGTCTKPSMPLLPDGSRCSSASECASELCESGTCSAGTCLLQ